MAPCDVICKSMLPPTEQLLLVGGDARIALDAKDSTNRYGCAPIPDPAMLAFGSSTATTISQSSFAAAERLQRRLLASDTQQGSVEYARELKRMRKELTSLCELDDCSGPDIVFAASGTDLHLIAASLVAEAGPMRVIVAGAEETGKGVPLAVAGRHFSAYSALGQTVAQGKTVAANMQLEVVTIPIRTADGMPRPTAQIDREVETHALAAAALGLHVLLIVVDVSKTGMIAPSPACAVRLRKHLGTKIDVLVDACQFRIAPATLRAYLQHELMVAITGSKFLTGPAFAGALLIPAAFSCRVRGRPLPPALSAYSARADWPVDWKAASSLDDVSNFGLLLRWEAALQELRAFRAISPAIIAQCLRAFALAINRRLNEDPAFVPLPAPHLDRQLTNEKDGWDHLPTIFPFVLQAPDNAHPLNREQTIEIYQLLQHDTSSGALRCQLGQPVDCGERDGVPVSALRLCISARLIVEAASQGSAHIVIEKAMAVLDKAALLVHTIS